MEKKEETKEAPEARTRFNTVALHKSSRRNAIRAYVHSDQVVMAGSTLKMRLGEDCFTDDGRRVRKDSAGVRGSEEDRRRKGHCGDQDSQCGRQYPSV
ncbi:conjugative transposon protein TraM [Phocaeicola dorei]|nr:conjugative transposon protein TraM [Phocaeicola dorei]